MEIAFRSWKQPQLTASINWNIQCYIAGDWMRLEDGCSMNRGESSKVYLISWSKAESQTTLPWTSSYGMRSYAEMINATLSCYWTNWWEFITAAIKLQTSPASIHRKRWLIAMGRKEGPTKTISLQERTTRWKGVKRTRDSDWCGNTMNSLPYVINPTSTEP